VLDQEALVTDKVRSEGEKETLRVNGSENAFALAATAMT